MPSHVIKDWRYDGADRTLTVRFVNGRRYRYDNVPVELAEEMRRAFAKGVFFNQRVRGRYSFSRVSDAGGVAPALGPPSGS